MKRRRVKITGIGPVTPAGIGREAFWEGILAGRSYVRPFTKLAPELGEFVAASIDRFQIGDYVSRESLPKGVARHTLFALAGAWLALRDAGLDVADVAKMNSVIVAGSSLMDFEGIGRTIGGFEAKGLRGAVPRTVFTTNAAVIPATIGQVFRLNTRTIAIQTSCCAGLDAIGHAVRLVAEGAAEIAICGGTEAPLFRCPLVELRSTGLTPSTAENAKGIDRPFDLWRTTGVVSEGAAMLVIEPESSPREGYSFITGYAAANDPADDLCGGMAVAMKRALAEARLKPDQVDVINAWGPGHRIIDAAESRAAARVFGDALGSIPAFSIKGAVGNALGAAPAIQVAVSALSHRHGVIPPTVNWQFADPECPLNLSSQARIVSHEHTLVNAHGLSGVNASLVMQRC